MRRLEVFFDKYGRFVARHPLPFLIVPIITTLISCVGLFSFQSQDDIWDIYSPLNAMSRVEEAAMEKFEHIAAKHHYRIQVLVERKDNGSLLNAESLQEMSQINNFVVNNITAYNSQRGFAYRDICGIYCNDSNAFAIGFVQASMQNQTGGLSFTLSYPNGMAFNNPVFLGYSLGRLETIRQDNQDIVTSFKLFVLHYMVDTNLPGGTQIRDTFERRLMNLFNGATQKSANLKYSLLSRNRELYEQRQITITAIPFLGLTGVVLTIFMIVTLLNHPLYKSQCIEALFGVISPGMALVTTFGLVWGCGLPFTNILTVVPFLVVTIGVDDAFLILAGWRQSNPRGTLESRMGESLAKSGASVTVTSVTDVLCFGVGVISNMPVVQLFCIYTSIALTIDFIYQITFFTAIVSYCGKRQITLDEAHRESNESSPTGSISSRGSWKKHLIRKAEMFTRVLAIQKVHDADVSSNLDVDGHRTWLSYFVEFIHSGFGQFLILGTFVLHVVVTTYLCTLVNTNFDMSNLYLKESPLTPISRTMQDFFLNEAFVVNFVLNPMGSFKDEGRRKKFHKLIDELESIPTYGMGSKGSNLWTREYETTAQFWAQEDEDIWSPVQMASNYRIFNMDQRNIYLKKNEKGEQYIDAFTWHITYHNMKNTLDVEDLLLTRRAILKRYEDDFQIYSHHPLEKVPTESAASAPANFLQTGISAIILMSILVFFFIMNAEAIFVVIVSIISISCGTVAYLHLWGVNLDAVSLISILMSIGFSVDYSAHVCYHYYTLIDEDDDQKQQPTKIIIGADPKNGKLPEGPITIQPAVPSTMFKNSDTFNRLMHTFRGVGWPVIQAGVSTMLGMGPLFFVDAYVVALFYKCILIVSSLGLLHALFLLPAVFVFMSRVKETIRKWFY
ncbi:Patched domain-containing protein 3 [Aphelenchoides besseyi]|nr:Patched domain-containing protein 3 [Aphelenchoides besseyi]